MSPETNRILIKLWFLAKEVGDCLQRVRAQLFDVLPIPTLLKLKIRGRLIARDFAKPYDADISFNYGERDLGIEAESHVCFSKSVRSALLEIIKVECGGNLRLVDRFRPDIQLLRGVRSFIHYELWVEDDGQPEKYREENQKFFEENLFKFREVLVDGGIRGYVEANLIDWEVRDFADRASFAILGPDEVLCFVRRTSELMKLLEIDKNYLDDYLQRFEDLMKIEIKFKESSGTGSSCPSNHLEWVREFEEHERTLRGL